MAFFPAAVATTANLYTAVNSLQTTLATALGTGDTSVVLASSTGFPTAGAATIDNEVIFYTGISGATLTGCTRGADGTTAATHSVGVPVGAAIVAFHHNGLMTEVIAVETFLNTKMGTSGSAYTTARALQSNSSTGVIEVSSVTNTELGYLSGVTSAIQTQLSAKATDSSVMHLAGSEVATGAKEFQNGVTISTAGTFSCSRRAGFTGSSVDIGTAGTAGLLDIYPATSGRGTLRFVAADNGTGDPIVTVTNASHSASRTYTIPDCGAAASFVMSQLAQTIAGQKTFSAATLFPNGTEALPGIAMSVQPNMGFWRNGTDQFRLSVNGRTQMQWNDVNHIFYISGNERVDIDNTTLFPVPNNGLSLGKSAFKWIDVWAVNGSIQTCMSDTKTNIQTLDEADPAVICKVPKPALFTRPGEDISKQRLGWLADTLPESAHPIDRDTGERCKDDVYTDSILAMHSLALRRDYIRLADHEEQVADLTSKISSLESRLAALEAR